MTKQTISVRFLAAQLAGGGIHEVDQPAIRVIRARQARTESYNQFSPPRALPITPVGHTGETLTFAVLWVCGWSGVALCFF